MLFSSVIDPEALALLPDEADDLRSRDGLISFLRGVIANGVVLYDSQAAMLKAISSKADESGRRDSQLSGLLTEVLKTFTVRLPGEAGIRHETEPLKTLRAAFERGKADCLLTRRPVAVPSAGCVAPEHYLRSNFEESRRAAAEHALQLDRMSDPERDKLLERIFKYATWVRIFDKQIGRMSNVRRFRDGIEWFLRGWQRHRLFPPTSWRFIRRPPVLTQVMEYGIGENGLR